MNKKYAIFDMDGTLVDSMVYWRGLGREYLERKGVTEDLDEVLELIKPMTMSESAKLFVDRFGVAETPKQAEDEMNAMMEEHYRADIPLKNGVEAYLEKLHRNGIKMCVASATAESLMEVCLSRLGAAKYFEFLLSCETVGAGKRHPDVYFEAVKRLHAPLNEIAVYEDALYAVKTAKEAGFYTVGVFDASGRHWDEVCELADKIIIDWKED